MLNKTFRSILLLTLLFTSPSLLAAGKEEPAPTSTPLQYTVEEVTGNVTILKAGETKEQKVEEGDAVLEGDEVRVGSDSEAVLFLDEDTVIHLGEKSEMKVGKLQPSEGGGFLNRLQLLAGRIMSEVKNLSKARSSFEVESGGVVCGVRGTAFEVERAGDQVETATYEGDVEVKSGETVEHVKAGYRYGFLKNRVQMKRKLDRTEKDRFEKWMKHRSTLKEKYIKRLKARKALREKAKTRQIKRTLKRRERR